MDGIKNPFVKLHGINMWIEIGMSYQFVIG